LEELAVKFVIFGPYQLFFYCLIPFLVGGFAAIFIPKPDLRLARGAYVFASGLVYFVSTLSYISWARAAEAIMAGRAWILMLDSVGSSFVLGIVIALLATARSYDARGHGDAAFMAFIPVANIFLFFARSKDKHSSTVLPWLVRGFAGVALGVALQKTGGYVVEYTFEGRINSIMSNQELPIDIYNQFVSNNTGP
jgi:hypothetical protein